MRRGRFSVLVQIAMPAVEPTESYEITAVRLSRPAVHTVSVRLIWPFRAANQALGVSADAAWENEGFSIDQVLDANTRVPWEVTQRLLTWGVGLLGIGDMGLLAAEAAEPGLFDLPEYVARSQSTLGGAIGCLRRLLPLLSDVGEVDVQTHGETAIVTLVTPREIAQHPATAEFTLAYLLLAARRFTGIEDLAPREVHLTHSAPSDTSHHERLFGVRPRFDSSANRLLLSSEQLDLPLQHADSQLSALLNRIAERLLAELSRSPSTTERVRTLIARYIGDERASAKNIARELAMAPRTLHRRLAEEGTTFRQLADDVRRALALAYLEERDLGVSEIAYLLGFSGVPAFHRAFKRWTNRTPGAYVNRR
jgi:AraC-like DNA-binding protein